MEHSNWNLQGAIVIKLIALVAQQDRAAAS